MTALTAMRRAVLETALYVEDLARAAASTSETIGPEPMTQDSGMWASTAARQRAAAVPAWLDAGDGRISRRANSAA